VDVVLEILKAILFGIIEGITEWLPISSTGHLILLNEVFTLKVSDAFLEMFQVIIQLGAIAAVVVLFWEKLWPFSSKKDAKQKQIIWSLWIKVIFAVLPSAFLGLLLDDWMDEHLYNHIVVALTLILYGIAFIFVENRNRDIRPRIRSVHAIDIRTALLIGCFQCLSLIPGTSRSGSTILGGILLGVSRGAASEFSFFLAIPTMVGAGALKLVKFLFSGVGMTFLEFMILVVGCLTSFAVSFFVIRKLMEYVRKNSFAIFGVYRIALGVVVILYFLFSLL
jgi:undecaprenyl-diphosphatase